MSDHGTGTGMGAFRTCVIGLLLVILLVHPVAATGTMFRAGPLHTGIFESGGTLPSNTSIWQVATGGSVSSSPAVMNGTVYAGSDDRNLYAVDALTGAKKWQFATGSGISSSPAVVNGIVYVGGYDRYVYAIDAETGQERWRFLTANFVSSSPVVSDGVVYIGSDDDHLYAIDAVTGIRKWAFATQSDVFSSPAIADGVVYVGSYDKNLYAINAVTGRQLWLFRTRSFIHSSPAVSGGIVYVGSNDKYLYAVDALTGAEKWRFATGGPVTSSPAVSGSVVYVGSQDTNLYAIDAGSGKQKWRFTTGNYVSSSPAISGGVVYVGSNDKYLYAVDALTGAEKWRFATGGAVTSSPAVSDGIVYAGSYDRNLYAVGGKPAGPVSTATEIPITVPTQPATLPTSSGNDNGGDLLSPIIIVLLGAVLLIGAGSYFFLKQLTSTVEIPASGPVAKPPVAGPAFSPVVKPEIDPTLESLPNLPYLDPEISLDARPEINPAEGPVPIPPVTGHPRPAVVRPEGVLSDADPFTSRLKAIEARAAPLAVFRVPVERLLSRSRELHNRQKAKEALHEAEEAEAAIEFLKECESHLAGWKKQGYDTTRLESLKTESAEYIYSAFHEFDHAVGAMETIRDDLETLKRYYPSIITQAGFPDTVLALEQRFKKPDTASAARSDFEHLKHDIDLYAREQEQRERHIRNEVIRIEQDITDADAVAQLKRIKKILRSGDIPAAEQLFRDLVNRQLVRVDETIQALRNEGAVVPASLLPVHLNDGDREYGDQLIEALMKLDKLGRTREQFREATILKDRVTDPRLIGLYKSGNYEEFMTEYENLTKRKKDKGLVFISAKSEDFQYANQVYTFLTERGYDVFFSLETLPVLGKAEFGEAIDSALERAKHLIVVTSKKEYVTSDWVKSEWRMFLDEKRAGRKRGNIITLITGSMRIEDLPIGLRNYETKFLDDPKTLEQLLYYLN